MIKKLFSVRESDHFKFRKDDSIYIGPWILDRIPRVDLTKYKYFNSEICSPYGYTNNETILISELYQKYYYTVLNKLIEDLNHLHNKRYSSRYWTIVLGPWYSRFFELILNRYLHLKKIVMNFPSITYHIGNKIEFNYLIRKDEKESVIYCNDNTWNSMLNYYLIKFFFPKLKILMQKIILIN